MLRSIKLNRFRRFEDLEIPDLARVNLFVGRNNVGKSSVLEAVGILASASAMGPWSAARRRREYVDKKATIQGMIHGFKLEVGAGFSLAGQVVNVIEDPATLSVSVSFDLVLASPENEEDDVGWIAQIERHDLSTSDIPVGAGGEILRVGWHRDHLRENQSTGPIHALGVTTADRAELARMLSEIALTDQEDAVLSALKLIEPSVKRVAPVIPTDGRPDVRVRLTDVSQPVPLSSLGEGTTRVLALALALSASPKGVLLLDEIDVGLHHSVMSNVWKMVIKTAIDLDVQVFATTHSEDCWRALGQVAEAGEARLYRIETGGVVAYSDDAFRVAAEEDIEVR